LYPPPELVNGRPHTGKLFLDFSPPKSDGVGDMGLDLSHPDDRIILSCLALKERGQRVVLVTNDASCRVKATIIGIEAEEYLSDAAGVVQGEEDNYPGFHLMPEGLLDLSTKCFVVESRTRYEFGSKVVPNVARNEFLIIPNAPPLRVISRTKAGKVVGETFGFHSDIKAMGIELRNIGQELAMQLLLDTDVPAVSLAGRAGSGKTYVTLAASVYQVLSLRRYKRIIFTRSTQDADEPVGFLPGELSDKLSPWMGALWDNIDSLVEKGKYDSKKGESVRKLREVIQTDSLNFMKGRSITDTLIIVDEAQDLTPKALKMISTRVGEGSKIIFLGNVAQIDNPHLTEYTCGLSVFIRVLRESHLTGHVTLQDGVRSPFATLAEELL
jgi:PhoH-like ATPase